jgi:hypothetical protein
MSLWLNPSSLLAKAQFSIGIPCYLHTQFAAGLISRQSSFKHSKYSMKQLQSHQISTIASKEIESHCRTSSEGSCRKNPIHQEQMTKQ